MKVTKNIIYTTKNIIYTYDLMGLTEKNMMILENALVFLIEKWQDADNLIPANDMLSKIREMISSHKF